MSNSYDHSKLTEEIETQAARIKELETELNMSSDRYMDMAEKEIAPLEFKIIDLTQKLDKAVEALEVSCRYDESWEVEDCDNSELEKQRYLMFKKLLKEIKEGEG